MTKYVIGLFLVLILVIAVSAPDRPGEAVEFTIITPEYRATPGEVALSSGFNEVVNAQIDNVDAIATAVEPIFDFWNSAAVETPGNVVYGAEGNFGSLSITVSGTPTPGDQFWAGAVFDDYFEWYSAFESGSYWTMNLYDAHDEPRVTCIKVIPTAGVVEIFGTPLSVAPTPTPDPPIFNPITMAVYWGDTTTASGAFSTAWGANTIASDIDATAWGEHTTASGINSTTWGRYTVASGFTSTAFGRDIGVSGDYSVGIGLEDVPTTTPTYSVAANNVFVVMGGKVGIDNAAPDKTLDIVGDVNVTGDYYVDGTPIYTPTPINAGLLPNTPIWNANEILGIGFDGAFISELVENGFVYYTATNPTPGAGEYQFLPATELTPAATPTLIPTAAPPTPEIATWGTATAIPGEVLRYNTDAQVLEIGATPRPVSVDSVTDWYFASETSADAILISLNEKFILYDYYPLQNEALYQLKVMAYATPGAGNSLKLAVRVNGTPIPDLTVTLGATDKEGIATDIGYTLVDSDDVVDVYGTISGTPSEMDAKIMLYGVRRP